MNPWTGPRGLVAALVFSALLALPALGHAADCESGFREMRTGDGGRLFTTIVPYPSVNARKVLERFRSVAAQRGYIVISPADFSQSVATLGIAKPPAPGPVMVTADPAESLVSVTSIVPNGAAADAAHERSVVCGLLAAFDASDDGRRGTAAAAREAADESSDPSRTTLPTAIPKVNLLEPKSRFDAAAAREALKPGNAVIRGQACGGMNGALAYASSVVLLPATPYLEELLDLEKKAKSGRDSIVPEPEALSTRMVAKADAEGRFQFSRMKPGRYYLTTTIAGLFGGTRDVQVGRVEDAYGGANVYAKQDYTGGAESAIGKFVTVRDGETISVTLQPPISANPFHRGMRGSILGCHRLN